MDHEKINPGCASHAEYDRSSIDIGLLSPLQVRGCQFRNRLRVSPMCHYSTMNGLADDGRLVHLGNRAVGGCRSCQYRSNSSYTPR
ncbi:MAG: hypothetical protein ACSNEK_09015 [Parachlamydiaceae bacterium]